MSTRGRGRADMSSVTRVAIDETASRRGHNYITLFVDIDQARVLFVTEAAMATRLLGSLTTWLLIVAIQTRSARFAST